MESAKWIFTVKTFIENNCFHFETNQSFMNFNPIWIVRQYCGNLCRPRIGSFTKNRKRNRFVSIHAPSGHKEKVIFFKYRFESTVLKSGAYVRVKWMCKISDNLPPLSNKPPPPIIPIISNGINFCSRYQ